MDFLHPQKKRAHQRRLFIGYALIAIVIVLCTLALVLIANGYGVKRNGSITQNGLVFVASHPVSADIYINGQKHGSTDGRFVLEEGNYNFRLSQTGYRTWQYDVTLDGGSIERLVYPFLFPEKLVSKELSVYSVKPDVVSESPDRHWIVVHQPTAMNTFSVVDASTTANTASLITVPATIITSRTNQHFEAVEWSTDDRHLLLKSVADEGVEYIMLDRQTPEASLNLSSVFGHSFPVITLHDKRYDQLYAYDATTGLLETADVRTGALSPIASHILAFSPYGANKVLYVTSENAPTGTVYVKIVDGDKTYTLRSLPTSTKYLLDMASYDGDEYVVVGTNTESKAYLYKNPLSSLSREPSKTVTVRALLRVSKEAEFVSFSATARFIVLQGGSTFAVYDAENNRQFRYDTKLPLDAGVKAAWMDGHRLMLTSAGTLNVFDFDGTNVQTLNAVTPGFTPMFDRDYTALFTLSPSTSAPDKTALTRTELLVK